MIVLLMIFSIILMIGPEPFQKHGHHLVGIPGQGVLAVLFFDAIPLRQRSLDRQCKDQHSAQ